MVYPLPEPRTTLKLYKPIIFKQYLYTLILNFLSPEEILRKPSEALKRS